MKKPWLAFLLNFLFPGAGLAYLGMWGWAVLNLVVVLILGFVLASAVAPDSLGAVSAGLGAGSGGLAMSLATSRNANAKAQSLAAPPAYAAAAGAGGNPAPVAPSGTKFCGSCGAPVTSSKFCGVCGNPIRPANQCPACGTVLEGPSTFCTECGHTMASGS